LVESAAGTRRGIRFEELLDIVATSEPERVWECLQRSSEWVERGHYVAGFLAYEAGEALHFTSGARARCPAPEHLVWFGIFRQKRELSSQELAVELDRLAGSGEHRLSELRFDTAFESYAEQFATVREHLLAGDAYQVCHSLRCRFELEGGPGALFRRLLTRQQTAYSAFIDTGEYALLSLSPELFFRKQGDRIELRPMKGTCPRGRDELEDRERSERLRSDPKVLAENVMIVDLVRNDVGRLARPGSVRVPELFSVERYETLLQLTSRITAELEPDTGLPELCKALFPCGSVTGAPKLSSMRIIRGLESSPRGIFCGSIGYITPAGDACFNVAIRTACIERSGRGVLGVGSGVVIDSTPEAEYAECRLKADFMRAAAEAEGG
jgi:para-aminobenzoate synthetase/4-amino-4-deoxychorismate lyase